MFKSTTEKEVQAVGTVLPNTLVHGDCLNVMQYIPDNEDDLVLDNCAGSFTTAIASNNLKRNWICIEKEKKYCESGLKRIHDNRIMI